MSTETCLTCSRAEPIEWHHVAGRRNVPELVVPLCVPCHRLVTAWQHASGVSLGEGPRSKLDTTRATLVGAGHLLELFLARHPEFSKLQPTDVRIAARYISASLDLVGDPKREGRWTPDATRTRHIDVHGVRRSQAEAFADWSRFLVQFDRILGSGPLRTAEALIREDPRVQRAAELVAIIGALTITVMSVSGKAREVAGMLSEADTGLAWATAALTLRLIADLQGAQRLAAG